MQDITVPILTEVLNIKAVHGFSYLDSAIIVAALTLGCHRLYSEDMQHGRRIGTMTIIDPFRLRRGGGRDAIRPEA